MDVHDFYIYDVSYHPSMVGVYDFWVIVHRHSTEWAYSDLCRRNILEDLIF